MDGMILGMMKKRIEKYQDIVKSFLNKQELSENQKEFLKKEKIINDNDIH